MSDDDVDERGASADGALAASSRRQDARAPAAAAAVLAVAPVAARARHSVSGPTAAGLGAASAARNKKRLAAAVHAFEAGASKKRTASVRPEMLGSAATLVGTGPAPPINAGGGVMVVDAAGARRPGAGGPSTTMRGGSERDPNVLSEYLQVSPRNWYTLRAFHTLMYLKKLYTL